MCAGAESYAYTWIVFYALYAWFAGFQGHMRQWTSADMPDQ